jgi:hypothetical protein
VKAFQDRSVSHSRKLCRTLLGVRSLGASVSRST